MSNRTHSRLESRMLPLLPIGDKTGAVDRWRNEYAELDKELLWQEDELDALIHLSSLLRKQRTEAMHGVIEYSDDAPEGRTVAGCAVERLNTYLELQEKSKGIDEAIANVKKECASTRSHCNWLFAMIDSSAEGTSLKFIRSKAESKWADYMLLDRDGAMDNQLNTQGLERLRDAGVIVGVFGASLAYTTLFTANRGRLDFVSFAFPCFILLLVPCVLLPISHSQRNPWTPDGKRTSSKTDQTWLTIYVAFIYILAFAGVILLSLSIVLTSDFNATPNVEPAWVIRNAGIIPLGQILGWVLRAIPRKRARLRSIFQRVYRHHQDGLQMANVPSHLVATSRRWMLLPGGDDYTLYRKQRQLRGIGFQL